ncbi:cation-translocating P-type ATPase [Craterilacuibacter sp.]|uniref:cation-translocating P-type ATPase n=1 Tax=Craterilacuibacter sp. TaxID=2870909 RepID=UPI003F2C5D26
MNLQSPVKGLSSASAAALLQAEGANELASDQRRTVLRIVLEVAREPMFLLLLGAGAIYLLTGDAHEALILLGFVCVIIAVTVLQERRTEHALAALRDLSSPRALVIRDGVPQRIAGREVVRGDVLMLAEGDRVPADACVLESHELALDESLLTGESVAVFKNAAGEGTQARVFAGTLLTSGQALVQVCATGQMTELGRIGKSLQGMENKSRSPLQHEIAALTRRLALIGGGLCVLLTVIFIYLRGAYLEGLLAGITLAMGILPQEFAVIMIVFLAFGARRLAAARVLTRRLSAIEALGAATVLCVDKTGTLTQNRMAVAALVAGNEVLEVADGAALASLPEAFHPLLEYAVLASETEPHDPMERAFHALAKNCLAGSEHLHPDWRLAHEYELSPELMAMSHLWQGAEHRADTVASKGSPEAIVDLCHLMPQARDKVMAQAALLADRGLRVLGVACARYAGEVWPAGQHDFDFEFVGLIALADPLRTEVPAAVAECHQAGIRIVMMTGDHPRTARAIAQAAGLNAARILTGKDLQGMDALALGAALASVDVFARVTPQQKLALVEALQSRGEIVAMTGDGVNDAPALKTAHIGIAMGKRGTDVAREAAALVLLDDDFGAIVAAVRLGRRIFANLRQAMIYTLAVHIPIIGLSIVPLLLGVPLLLAPLHIAFLELVIDPACSVVFEAEKGDAGMMQQGPRHSGEALLSRQQILLSLCLGMMATLPVLGLYLALLAQAIPVDEVRTLAFAALLTTNAVLIFSSRSALPQWGRAFAGVSPVTRWVLAATLCALAAISFIPFLAQPFGFSPPPLGLWLAALGPGLASFVGFEAVKTLLRRRDV